METINKTQITLPNGKLATIETVTPDPFNHITITENIAYGIKVTVLASGTEFIKWYRKDGRIFGGYIHQRMIDVALAAYRERIKK